MTTVSGTVELPGGVPCVGARVAAVLYTGVGATAYDTSNDVIAGQVATLTGGNGTWGLDLEANENITPAGTVWRVTVTRPGGPVLVDDYIDVPDSANTLDFTDLLVAPPDQLNRYSTQREFMLDSRDFPSLQAAFTAAAETGAATLLVAGDYSVTSPIECTMNAGGTLHVVGHQGVMDGSSIATDVDDAVLVVHGAAGTSLLIEGLTVLGGHEAHAAPIVSTSGIHIKGVDVTTVRDCKVTGAYWFGISIQGATGARSVGRVESCHVANAGHTGIRFCDMAYSLAVGCTVKDSGYGTVDRGYGISMSTGLVAANVNEVGQIASCHIYRSDRKAIDVHSCKDFTAIGNYIEGIGRGGIVATHEGVAVNKVVGRAVITGNTIRHDASYSYPSAPVRYPISVGIQPDATEPDDAVAVMTVNVAANVIEGPIPLAATAITLQQYAAAGSLSAVVAGNQWTGVELSPASFVGVVNGSGGTCDVGCLAVYGNTFDGVTTPAEMVDLNETAVSYGASYVAGNISSGAA